MLWVGDDDVLNYFEEIWYNTVGYLWFKKCL